MTTTAAAIRDAMIALVEGLTPTTLASDRFLAHREGLDFRTASEANPPACLRRFSIRTTGTVSPPTVTNTDVEWVETDLECVIAYAPNGRHGAKFLTDLDDAIEHDLRQIEHTIGTNGYAFYAQATAGATVTTVDSTREDGGPVTFAVLNLHAGFYRDQTP
jgi:hypothetical protein